MNTFLREVHNEFSMEKMTDGFLIICGLYTLIALTFLIANIFGVVFIRGFVISF